MIDFSEATLKYIVVHQIGNKHHEEDMIIAKSVLKLNEDRIKDLLKTYFLSHFKSPLFYNFTHNNNLNDNEVYNSVRDIFTAPGSFYIQSVNLGKRLYEKSEHPMIKGGEFYMAHFENCIFNGEITDVIGLFKSENKDTYLKVFEQDNYFELKSDEGININKLDKGCLVFNTDTDNGYQVCIIDTVSKGEEARYWKDEFLNLRPSQDDFNNTKSYLEMCKGFIDEVYNEDNHVSKPDQIDMMNKSMNFFKNKDEFSEDEFVKEVIVEPQNIDSFKTYQKEYFAENDLSPVPEFDISPNAVKNAGKYFRSVIKLDKNFHVYIHGNRNYVEKGFDEEKNMNFYKLFFEKES